MGPDLNNDGGLTVTGDVLNFRGRIGAAPGNPAWWQRLDLNTDHALTVTGDVLTYRGRIGETCTNPLHHSARSTWPSQGGSPARQVACYN